MIGIFFWQIFHFIIIIYYSLNNIWYGQPLEFRPHSYFVDFTSHSLFYIMTSLPAFIKVEKIPATQNHVLEQYAVKIGNSKLFLYDNYINLPWLWL
jgi:hypothetical protein